MSILSGVFGRPDPRPQTPGAIAILDAVQGETETLGRLADLSLSMSPWRAAWEVLSPAERSAVYSPEETP